MVDGGVEVGSLAHFRLVNRYFGLVLSCIYHDYEVCVRSKKSNTGWFDRWMDGWLVGL